jgi:ATP-dependent DNA ligase
MEPALTGLWRTQAALTARLPRDHRGRGAAIFQQACRMGLEGIVSKRPSAPYRSGP